MKAKSKFYVIKDFFSKNMIYSEGPVMIIKFHFYEGPSTFISVCTLAYLIKSKFYEVNEIFLENMNCSQGPIIIIKFHFDSLPGIF